MNETRCTHMNLSYSPFHSRLQTVDYFQLLDDMSSL